MPHTKKDMTSFCVQLETANGFDLTGEMQHGFKSGKSTRTAAMVFQSMIARQLTMTNIMCWAVLT